MFWLPRAGDAEARSERRTGYSLGDAGELPAIGDQTGEACCPRMNFGVVYT